MLRFFLSLRSLPFSGARLAPWVSGLLVVALAHSMAQLTWRLWPVAEEAGAPPPAVAMPQVDVNAIQGEGLGEVAGLHLFGEAGVQTAVASQPVAIDAPDTRLNLDLHGVLATGDKATAYAIIASGAAEKIYRIGDTLPGGALLEAIYGDRVILKRNGRLETLRLPKERKGIETETTLAKPLARGGSRGGGLRSKIEEYREKILANPQDAVRWVQVQPVMDDGRLKGYRVNPKDKQLMKEIGLQPDDVVTSVNGLPVNDPLKLGEIIKQLSSASRFTVGVERGGRQTTLNVQLD